ncbi:MAG: hypothetical protein GX885_05185 [Methanomicrobiales archaeon]|nr:hypothetical protein [Methanomicrobiales archaeon]
MARRITIPVRSLGSEVRTPTVPELAGWLRGRRGEDVDLTIYRLARSLDAQKEVTIPAAGGIFYGDRWREAFLGMTDGVLVDEPGIDPSALAADARYILARRKGTWFSLPAPHMLGFQDAYIEDAEEFSEILATMYARLAREMRDVGAAGHVLIADRADEIELEMLAARKIIFFPKDPGNFDLELLLEYQGDLILPAGEVGRAPDLMEQFRVRRLILIDPAAADLTATTAFIDHDMLEAGGYCEEDCPDYWKDLVERAFVTR